MRVARAASATTELTKELRLSEEMESAGCGANRWEKANKAWNFLSPFPLR